MDESTGQRCPACGYRFRVLADEAGMHACPRCGHDGRAVIEAES